MSSLTPLSRSPRIGASARRSGAAPCATTIPYSASRPRIWFISAVRSRISSDRTQSCFQRAIEMARKQSAKSWELRATMSLARLLNKRGRRDEARAMLAEIYGWFTEGFDTADLKDAKALVEGLRP